MTMHRIDLGSEFLHGGSNELRGAAVDALQLEPKFKAHTETEFHQRAEKK